jgi:hypothetical protein
MFVENFQKYADGVEEDVRQAGPVFSNAPEPGLNLGSPDEG